MLQLQCCGDTSANSWNGNIPSSCCEGMPKVCTIDKAFTVSCSVRLKEFLQSKAGILGGVAVGIAIIQV